MSRLAQRDPRIPKALAVTYQDGPSLVKAYAKDISPGGLFISTDNPLKQGEKFVLKLQIPGLLEPMDIQCEVAWARIQEEKTGTGRFGMGVKFFELTDENKELLQPYIQTIAKLGVKTLEMSEKDENILNEYLKTIE